MFIRVNSSSIKVLLHNLPFTPLFSFMALTTVHNQSVSLLHCEQQKHRDFVHPAHP